MIEIIDLQFKYSDSDTYAINGLSLSISKGKYIAVLGHNGSGKSTLSKLIVGLYKPTKGKIIIDGVEISRKNLRKIRSKIGIVFQNPDNQFIGASVEDDIAFGLENKQVPHNKMKQIVLDNAIKVGMEKYLNKEPQNLSGGQKQKVAIASILALDPDIIIFDEITSMLDPKGKQEVISLIKNIQESKNKTLISITHDMEEAILADEIIVLSQGKLVAIGKPTDILGNKKITELAKIDAPFIYKVSEKVMKIPTFDENKLLKALCK